MILDQPWKPYGQYTMDGMPGYFSATPSGIKVSAHAFHSV